ncbi:putative armadillo-like helical, CLASP domain, TOG domain-containing protein [Plasmopara halstedii]
MSSRDYSTATSVDALVYQLEDDKPVVRWKSLKKLRKIAAVETTHFPVRNARRFLQCVRRRIINEPDRRVAIEALRLIGDVMSSLGDNLDQILSSILPHLISLLPMARKQQENEEDSNVDSHMLYEEIIEVFRKYTIVTQDLQAAADLLVNIGLGSGQGSVREASLVALMQLLDERYQKRLMNHDNSKIGTIGRRDKAILIALVQAIVPALEDTNENVVVAAEEAIAKLQSYWGSRFSVDVMEFLSSVDKRTLKEHQEPINEFLLVCTNSASLSISPSLQLPSDVQLGTPRAIPPSPSLQLIEGLYFGFVKPNIVTTLTNYMSNSKADWKKRTAAVEQLYIACKKVDAGSLCGVSAEERGKRFDELVTLFDILIHLIKDIDVHIVKRALQITQVIFRKLTFSRQFENDRAQDDTNDKLDSCHKNFRNAAFSMTKLVPPIVETAANFAEDDAEMEGFVYALLGQIFASAILSVSSVEQTLACTLFHHRRCQVRVEAVKVWLVLLLIAERKNMIPSDYAPNENVVQTLGCLLGDNDARVRDLALEVVAVLTMVCRCNIYALLETCIDSEYVSQRVDWAALRARLWRKHVPKLQSNYTLIIKPAAASASRNPSDRFDSSVEQSLDNVSELRLMVMHEEPNSVVDCYLPTNGCANSVKQAVVSGENVENCVSDGNFRSANSLTTVDISDKLSFLKMRSNQVHESRIKRIRDHEVKLETTQVQPLSTNVTEHDDVDDQSKDETFSRSSGKRRVQLSHCEHISSPFEAEKCFSVQQQPTDFSPQKLQTSQSEGLAIEEHLLNFELLRSRQAHVDNQPQSPDERPIRPMNISGSSQINIVDKHEQETESRSKKSRKGVAALATQKRLEAKAKQNSSQSLELCHESASNDAVLADQHFQHISKQEPRYLEPHEIAPLNDLEEELSEVLLNLRCDDWEVVFNALSVVRRLAVHHSNVIDSNKVRTIIAEVMVHVMSLRSFVSKNALLALETMCAAFGREIDSEVENIVPFLLKRCADSNFFVSESAIVTLNTIVLKCSPARTVVALRFHVNSKAVPIRREIARAVHTIIVNQAEINHTDKDLAVVLQLVGQCLADSHNEVRNISKQTILHLHFQKGMSGEQIKRFLPALAQTKVDSVLNGKDVYSSPAPKHFSMAEVVADLSSSCSAAKRQVTAASSAKTTRIIKNQSSCGVSPPVSSNGSRIKIDLDELHSFETKLGSSNWKDRFDALRETTDFICSCASALAESGQILNLFDQLIKRLDDGNAKVNIFALECMEQIVPAVGTRMEQILPNVVPAITKNLANGRTSILAKSVLQKLCAHVDQRSLCQLLAIQARNANSRVLPVLLDTLTQLTAQSLDDKINYALTRSVLPLALTMLKEVRNVVKDANTRLLRQLQRRLGLAVVMSAASKLSPSQQDKLSSVLR